MLSEVEFESLLPWYLNGTASPAERDAIERYLEANPEALGRIAEHVEVHRTLRKSLLATKSLAPSSDAYATRHLAIIRILASDSANDSVDQDRNPEYHALMEAIEGVRTTTRIVFLDGWPMTTPTTPAPPAGLIVVGLQRPSASDVDALRNLRDRHSPKPVVVASPRCERELVVEMMRAGASAYLWTGDTREVLEGVLRLVLAGGRYAPPELIVSTTATSPMAAPQSLPHSTDVEVAAQALRKLNKRQLDIVRYMIQGRPMKMIARILGLSPMTIKAHTAAIYRALNVKNRTEVVKIVSQIPSFE